MIETNTNESNGDRRARIRKDVDRVLACINDGSDHYEVLAITRHATSDEIRKAYCEAVETFHPLKCQELTESDGAMRWQVSQAFLRVVEAFTTLSRPARRIEYDAALTRRPVTPLPLPSFTDPPKPGERTELDYIPSEPDNDRYSIGSAFGHSGPSIVGRGRVRQHTRMPLRVPVRVTSEEEKWQEVTESREVSRDDIQFRLSCPVESGTLLRLELPMPFELRDHSHHQLIYTVRAIVELASESDGQGYWVKAQFTNATAAGA
jgi:curved DNA-binding protein CbpA